MPASVVGNELARPLYCRVETSGKQFHRCPSLIIGYVDRLPRQTDSGQQRLGRKVCDRPVAGGANLQLHTGNRDLLGHLTNRFPTEIRTNGDGRNFSADPGDWRESRVIEIYIATVKTGANRVGISNDIIAIRIRGVDILLAHGTTAAGTHYRHNHFGKFIGHLIRQQLPDGLCRAAEKDGHFNRFSGDSPARLRCFLQPSPPQPRQRQYSILISL